MLATTSFSVHNIMINAINLFSALNFIPFVNLDLLLNGSSDFNHELNKRATLAVLKYIKDTPRFT